MSRRWTIGLAALSLLTPLAACGSEGAVSQPEDEFLDKVEAECRTAEKGIDRLSFDPIVADDVDQAVELLSTLVKALKDLEPPQSLQKDFDNTVDGIDDQVSEAKKLSRAAAAADTAATDTAIDGFFDATAQTDRAADSLGALDCKALAPVAEFVATGDTTPDTIPIETIPIDTTPVDTTPIETIPVDTTPVATDTTIDEAEVYPDDLNVIAAAPAGFEWVDDYTQFDVADLYSTTVLGDLVASYAVGQIRHLTESYTAGIYVMKINGEWTDEVVDQYLTWELVDEGIQVTTPAGLTVWQKFEAYEDNDCIAYYTGTTGIGICTASGVDGLPVLDAYLAANPI